MSTNYLLSEEIEGYSTLQDPSNTSPKFLIAGSKNVLVDANKKVRIRPGYMRLGVANASLTEVRNAWTWNSSNGSKFPQRYYSTILETYMGTIDGYTINAWKTVSSAFSATKKLRRANVYDSTEKIDIQIMTNGDANLYEWNGAIAIASSVSAVQIAEAGDVSNQMSAWSFSGMTSSNTNAFILYWKLTDSAGTRTVNIYKDSAGTNLVATGSHVGDGVVTLTASGGSGLTGSVTVAYSGDDTTVSANTLTLTYNVTKLGTNTFGQNRFYTTRNKTFINLTTGQEYTYSGGESTTTLTNVVPATSMDIVNLDILVQKVVTQSNKPASSRINDTIVSFRNQIFVGSETDNLVYASKDTDYTTFSFSSPRISGEGGLFTLTDPSRGFGIAGSTLVMFCGRSSAYRAIYTQITVNTTLTEALTALPLALGVSQGSLCADSIVSIGNSVAYLSNEVAVRVIDDPVNLPGINPKTFSNPIKPDFDSEDWLDPSNNTSAFASWYKNMLIFTAPQASHMYMLNFVESADGKVLRFWNPPQVLPVGAMSIIDSGNGELLHGHSNSVPETYLLFDGASDGQYSGMEVTDKLPIDAKAIFAYDSGKKPANLKTFDEYFVKGEITPSTTDLLLTINYNYDGYFQKIEKTIDGSDQDILEGSVGFNSLAQQSLAINPLGGLLNPPTDARKFRVDFEIPREDFFEINASFGTNEVDRYWAIIAHGSNMTLSPRKNITIRK